MIVYLVEVATDSCEGFDCTSVHASFAGAMQAVQRLAKEWEFTQVEFHKPDPEFPDITEVTMDEYGTDVRIRAVTVKP